MITISSDQALLRWDTLSENMRDVLTSEVTSDFLWKTCESEHIPDEKIYTVSRLVGYVLFGFLHPEDLAREIRDALQIDIRIATVIASAVNERIFAPIRSEIDKVYAPAGSAAPATSLDLRGAGVAPKMMQEITPIAPVSARPSSGPAFPRVGAAPAAPLGPRPTVLGDLQKTDSGKISFTPRPPVNAGSPMPQSTVQTAKPAPNISQPSSPRSASPAPAPMPVFMDSDAATRPLAKTPDFPMKSIDRIASLGTTPPPSPSRPAVIEFGVPKPPSASPKPVSPPPPPVPPTPPLPPRG